MEKGKRASMAIKQSRIGPFPQKSSKWSFESRSFENSYIPENPRTPKPLTFSKNRLRGAKNRSNISPVAKKNFRKNDFFFPKNFAYVQTFFLCICAQFFVLFQNRSKTRNFFIGAFITHI
ncbi:hypothetical protein LXL04_000728 [Taraxacum kok-saghyz]